MLDVNSDVRLGDVLADEAIEQLLYVRCFGGTSFVASRTIRILEVTLDTLVNDTCLYSEQLSGLGDTMQGTFVNVELSVYFEEHNCDVTLYFKKPDADFYGSVWASCWKDLWSSDITEESFESLSDLVTAIKEHEDEDEG